MKTLEKGSVITCPRKNHKIATLIRPVFTTGVMVSTKDVEFEPDQEKIAGMRPVCSICGSLYIKDQKIHTDSGWFPSDPRIEPVSF